MKKLISLTLAMLLILSLSVPAFAKDVVSDEDSMTASGTTTVSTMLAPKYTMIIPADTQIDWGATSTRLGGQTGVFGISTDVEDTRLERGYGVQIDVNHSDYFAKQGENASGKIDYNVSIESFLATTSNPTSPISILIEKSAWDAADPGIYECGIIFNASYVENPDY